MNITLNIVAGSAAELQDAIAGLAGIVGGTTKPLPEPEKPKRGGNRTTAQPEKQPDPAPIQEPDSEPAEVSEGTDSESTETEHVPTVVELRALASEKGKTPEDKKAIKALLDEFGSKSISDVPEEKRASFFKKLEAL